MKTFCPTHCFNYTGNVCPFCEQDRINALARKHTKTVKTADSKKNHDVKKEQEDSVITAEMLQALKMKFSNK